MNSTQRFTRRLRRPAPGTVVGTIAICISLSGTAAAAAYINGQDIIADTINDTQIANGGVGSSSLARSSVQWGNIALGAVNSTTIADHSIKRTDVDYDAVGQEQLTDAAVGVRELKVATVRKTFNYPVNPHSCSDFPINGDNWSPAFLGTPKLEVGSDFKKWEGFSASVANKRLYHHGLNQWVTTAKLTICNPGDTPMVPPTDAGWTFEIPYLTY